VRQQLLEIALCPSVRAGLRDEIDHRINGERRIFEHQARPKNYVVGSIFVDWIAAKKPSGIVPSIDKGMIFRPERKAAIPDS
jgi:hypothetical protein